MNIKIVDYETAKQFVKVPYLTLKPHYVFYGLFSDNRLCSIIAVEQTNPTTIKTHCNYTPIEHRGKGYFSFLLKSVMNIFDEYSLSAECTDDSLPIYLKAGFVEVSPKQHFKKYNITKVRYYNGPSKT